MRPVSMVAVTVLALGSLTWSAEAEVYPSRPITLIVPWPSGGPSDTPARVVAERMRVSLGQPVVVENVAGGSGSAGTGRVARAAPDGYTLVHGNFSTHVINGAVFKLAYDVQKDFAPISLLAQQSFLIVGRKTLPAENLTSLIAWLKANPEKASQATGGPGGMPHLMGLRLQRETGTRFNFVPYRGTAVGINDLVAGHIDFMIDASNNTLPHVRAGTIKAYAATAPSRLASAPEIPTVDEAGLPGFYFSSWQALYAPKDTPASALEKLQTAVGDALADPEVRRKLSELGQDIYPRDAQTPAALATLQKADIDKWWPLIQEANIKAD